MTKSGASLVKYPCGLQGLFYTVLSLLPIFVFDIKNFRPLDQTVGGGLKLPFKQAWDRDIEIKIKTLDK